MSDNDNKEFSLGGNIIYNDNPEKLYIGIDRQFLFDCSTKKVMVYIYLARFRSWADNILYLTIEHLVKYFGFKPNNDEGKINSQFRDILQEFIDAGYITTSVIVKGIGISKNKDYIKPVGAKDLFSIKVVDKNLFKMVVDPDNYKGSGFVQLTMSEMDTMLDNMTVSKSDLIMCYLAIKQYINMGESHHKIAFPTIDTIGGVINRQSKAVGKLIDELINLKLLYKKNCGAYKKTRYGNTEIKNFPIVYALEEKYLCQTDTVLADIFKYDELVPFIEPPHKDKKDVNDMDSNSIAIGDDTEEVHTDPVVVDNFSGDESAIEINSDYSFKVQEDDIDHKPIVDMNEYELIKQMSWDKEDAEIDEIIPVMKSQKPVERMSDNEWRDSLDKEDDYYNGTIDEDAIDVSSIGNNSDDKMPWEDEDLDELLFGA